MNTKISICNFIAVSDLIYTAGQPQEAELQQLLSLRVQTVINLGLYDTEYALHDEAASITALGMAYSHIPVSWESPQKQQLISFMIEMYTNKDQKIFVHCAANKRVSIFMGIYQLLFSAEDRQAIETNIVKVWQPNSIWQHFMDEMLLDRNLREKVLHYIV